MSRLLRGLSARSSLLRGDGVSFLAVSHGQESVESASKRSSAGGFQEKRRQNARGFVRYCENHRRERQTIRLGTSGKGGHAEMMNAAEIQTAPGSAVAPELRSRRTEISATRTSAPIWEAKLASACVRVSVG